MKPKQLLALLLALFTAFSLAACAEKTAPAAEQENAEISEDRKSGKIGTHTFTETDEVTNYVKMDIEGYGMLLIELSPEDAPITVANFQNLVKSGFYNGLTIHRVEPSFVIQGGDPKGDGTGSSDAIKGEFSANGVANTLSHKRGVISMARRGDSYDSGSCQFFICLNTANCTYSLDGQYAAFGWVLEGMDVVDKIEQVETVYKSGMHMPVDTITMTSVTFVTVTEG